MEQPAWMFATILSYMVLVMVYSLLAAVTVEVLLALWQVKDPPLDIAFRLIVLAIPPVAPLLFALLDPLGLQGNLRRGVALLELRNWVGAEPHLGHPAWALLLAIVAATALLEAVALVRWLRAGKAGGPERMSGSHGRLGKIVDGMARRGISLPPVRLTAHAGPAAYTVGLLRPAILVSPALVDLLDDEELEAVLAHEAAHAERQDNWLGWLTFLVRLGSFYNPVAHFTYHRMGHDVERVCDARAAGMTGKGLPLASALIKVYMATRRPVPATTGLENVVGARTAAMENRARRKLVEDRAERLVRSAAVRPATYPPFRLTLAALALLGLMYLVV